MKKVIFDLLSAQPVKNSKFHGGGEYIKTIFEYFVKNYSKIVEISVFYSEELFLDEYIIEIIKENDIKVIDIKSMDEIQEKIDFSCYDIFYSGIPYAYGNINFPESITRVGSFHGFRALEKYTDDIEKYYFTGYKAIKPFLKKVLYKSRIKKVHSFYLKGMNNFNKIICSSNHTKYAIKSFFPNIGKEIETFYVPQKYVEKDKIDKNEKIEKIGKYILIIGLNRWEKNGYRALRAIEELFGKGLLNDYKIVTVGDIPKKLERFLKHKDKYIRYGYVEAEILEALYMNCDFFMYPSLNEGFGMPPLEAMKYGKTCIVSGVCSLPELCGDAVLYVNPYDINEIQTRIINAVEEKIDENKVIERQEYIAKRQDEDIKKICEYIIS